MTPMPGADRLEEVKKWAQLEIGKAKAKGTLIPSNYLPDSVLGVCREVERLREKFAEARRERDCTVAARERDFAEAVRQRDALRAENTELKKALSGRGGRGAS